MPFYGNIFLEMLRTVASPGTGCHDRRFFYRCTEVIDKRLTPTTACGSPSPPAFHDFVHQRGERASSSCTDRESRARSARSDRFCGGKARDQGCSLFSFFPPKIAGFILVFFLFLLYPQRQFFPAFLPDLSQSRSVVGDIRKNGQNFSDLNFHKI